MSFSRLSALFQKPLTKRSARMPGYVPTQNFTELEKIERSKKGI